MAEESLLSDELLQQLMAAGQVDVLVGVPTLNNAETIGGVVRAVHQAFATYFPRDRPLLINSDGGSLDGTPDVVRGISTDDAGTLIASHSLRTIHRITTPYNGLPGKGSALRQIFAAADLTNARAVAVLDPEVASVTPEWIAALLNPVKAGQFDFVAPVYARHPLDGPLVTQIVRPLMRAAYGWQVREPLAGEFGCSGAFAAHCLEQDVWHTSLAGHGIDLWVTGAALSGGFRCCQAPVGPRVHAAAHARPGFQDVFQQVVGALFECIEMHAPYWLAREGSEPLNLVGTDSGETADAPTGDPSRLTQSFCADLQNLQGILEPILAADTLAALNKLAEVDCEHLRYPDALWASTVYDFLEAHRSHVMRREHITQALIPLYLGRTGSFLMQHAADVPATAEAALDSLCTQFERSRPRLVERWTRQARGE